MKLTLWIAVCMPMKLSCFVSSKVRSYRNDPNTSFFYSVANMAASVTSTAFDKKKLSTACKLLLHVQTDTWSRCAVTYSLNKHLEHVLMA